ncbi:MAG: methylenetetrahydrofolate reductase C-terminal domain-containing protein [bacterium]
MIVADQKDITEIIAMTEGYRNILVIGCDTCVTVCLAGGAKEVAILASGLRLAAKASGRQVEVHETSIERQCEKEFVDALHSAVKGQDLLISTGCGIGVQTIAEQFPQIPVVPALNTKMLGLPERQGVWVERCQACGQCILDKTGGICPISRCSKSLLNGPCGGSQNGKCEINKDIDCGWHLIYERLKALGRLACLEEIMPAKNWSTSRDGGPRKVIREDMCL